MAARRPIPLGVKLFGSLCFTLLLLGLLELGARLLSGSGEEDRSFGQFEEQVHVLLRRGMFVRDPDLFWRLAPVQGVDTPIAPGGLRVNSLGLRGPEWTRATAPGYVRIVTLGDSCTFGWRVSEEDAYPVALGRRLRDSGIQVEVINAGVPGYTSFQALRLLKRDLLPLGPRLVVLCFGWNELWPARGQQDTAQAVSGGLVSLENLLDESRLYRLLRRGYVQLRSDLGASRTAQTLPRVSPEQFRGLLEELADLCQKEGLQLCLLTQPAQNSPHPGCWSPPQHQLLLTMQGVMREVATRRGALLVDAAALLAPEPQAETFIDCVHPTSAGHAKIAEALAAQIGPRLRQGLNPPARP